MTQRTKENPFPAVCGEFLFKDWAVAVHAKRFAHGLSVRDLAKVCRVSPSMISRWENRLSMPLVPDYLFLCKYFDLHPWDYYKPTEPVDKTENMFTDWTMANDK